MPNNDNYFEFEYTEHPEKDSLICLCGGEKSKRVSVCYQCFISLPEELSAGLHKQFGRGYEEGYVAVKAFLEENL